MNNLTALEVPSVLSRLTVAVGDVFIYDSGVGFFAVLKPDLVEAHTATITSGAHPYASVTSFSTSATFDWQRPADERDVALLNLGLPEGLSIVEVLGDWLDWCDDVVAAAEESVEQVSVPGDAPASLMLSSGPDTFAVLLAMRQVGRAHIDEDAWFEEIQRRRLLLEEDAVATVSGDVE